MKKGEVAWNKGKKLSPEHRKKVIKNLVRGYWQGKKFKKKHKEKIRKIANERGFGKWMVGRRNSIKTEFKKGQFENEKHRFWKGDDVGIMALHRWIYRHYGRPTHCEDCGVDKIPIGRNRWFEWSNNTGVYLRDRENWRMRCVPCHRKFDKHPFYNK